jgi:hypothetical protein
LQRWKDQGIDYESLPQGNVEEIGPFYPDDSDDSGGFDEDIDEEVESDS